MQPSFQPCGLNNQTVFAVDNTQLLVPQIKSPSLILHPQSDHINTTHKTSPSTLVEGLSMAKTSWYGNSYIYIT